MLTIFIKRLFIVLNNEEHWLQDHRFITDEDRGNNGEVLSERTEKWCASLTSEEALVLLEQARIPAGPLLSPQ